MKILAFLRVALLVCITLWLLEGAEAALPVAHVRGVRPVILVSTRAGSNSWRPVRDKQPLRYGNVIRAGAGGKAEVIFDTGTRVALKPGSELELVSPPDAGKPLVLRLIGALGEVFVRAKGPTEIYTASGTAAVRGTQYFVRLDSQNQTSVTVTEGKVAFYNKVDPTGVLLTPGQTSSATPTTAPSAPTTVDVSGLFGWTGEVMGLPLPFEWTIANPSSEGERLFNESRFGEAAMALENASKTNGNARVWAALGRAQLFEGDTTEASKSYAKVKTLALTNEISQDAIIADALIRLSGANLSGDQLKAQVVNADQAPLFPAVQGLADLQSGNTQAAIRHLSGQNSFQGKTLLALALIQENDLPKAQAVAREAVQLAPNSAGAHAALSMVSFFQSDAKAARREAEKALKLDPLSPLALLALGRAELAAGRTDDARSAFAQAAALAPELPVIQIELGVVETRLDHLPQAEKAFRRALEKTPNDARALGGLATVVARQGKPDEARGLFAKAIEANPGDPNVRAQYAGFLVEQGDLKGARETAEELLATQKADTPAVGALLIRLSEAALFRQELPDAFEYARRAVGLLPRSALAHYQWGRVYFEQGRIVQAQNQFRIATQLDLELARARYALGLTQEIRSSGRDITSPIGQSAAALESGQSASIIRDLLTPGATERVQASVQDPTVARVATRSIGDIQADILVGQDSTLQGSISALLPSDDRRRLFGVNAEHSDYDGPRDNSGNKLNRGELIYGQKSDSNPSGFWGFAQTQKTEPGLDTGLTSNPYNAGLDVDRTLSTALFGYNLQRKESQRTRFLFGVDRLEYNSSDAFNGTSDRDVKSVHGEVRHDAQFNDHRFSAGLSIGRRTFDNTDFLFSPDPAFPSLTSQTNYDYDAATAYLRDVWQPNPNWRITAELKGIRLQRKLDTLTSPALPGVPDSSTTNTRSKLLPNLIVEHYFSERTNVRLRARKLLGSFTDFDLLAPADVFLFAASEDYLPRLGRAADALDFELDHTFKDGSFLRLGAFRRDLDGGVFNTTGLSFTQSRVDGLTLGYEGLLNRQTSYFINGQLLRGRGNRVDDATGTIIDGQRVGGVPRVQVEIGAQYLADNGFFVQPSIGLIGKRDVYRSQAGTIVEGEEGNTFLANLRVGKRWGLRSVAYVEVVNLFDKKYSAGSDFNQRLMSDRQIRAGLSYRF